MAAHKHNVPIERISFSGSATQINQWLDLFRHCRSTAERLRLMQQFCAALVDCPLPNRPGRSEPRAVKRRPKNFKILTAPRHMMHVEKHRGKYQKKSLS